MHWLRIGAQVHDNHNDNISISCTYIEMVSWALAAIPANAVILLGNSKDTQDTHCAFYNKYRCRLPVKNSKYTIDIKNLHTHTSRQEGQIKYCTQSSNCNSNLHTSIFLILPRSSRGNIAIYPFSYTFNLWIRASLEFTPRYILRIHKGPSTTDTV